VVSYGRCDNTNCVGTYKGRYSYLSRPARRVQLSSYPLSSLSFSDDPWSRRLHISVFSLAWREPELHNCIAIGSFANLSEE
jgi:hypothetical protein